MSKNTDISIALLGNPNSGKSTLFNSLTGLSQKTGNRKLVVDVKRKNGQIRISVEDNGIGREASAGIVKVSTGKGIGFTKERLDLIAEKYGTQYQFNIYDLNNTTEKAEEKGTKVEICFVED